MTDRISYLLATCGNLGRIPGAPGTYAATATVLAFFAISRLTSAIRPELYLSVLCIVTLFGTLASARASRSLGEKDPQVVVIDEVAGQMTALLFLPADAFRLIGGLALFRLFDIWKPYPIRRLEGLRNGVGIMADDLLAGVYANLLLRLAGWLLKG